MANKSAHASKTTIYNVKLACYLADKIKGAGNVVAAVLLQEIHDYESYNKSIGRAKVNGKVYAPLSVQFLEDKHPEFKRNTIQGALKLLEQNGLCESIRPEKNAKLPNGKLASAEYRLLPPAYPFFENPEEDEKPEPKKKKEKEVDNSYIEQISDVLTHLNSITGKRYRATAKVNADPIRKLLKDGYSTDDLIAVIDHKAAEWKGQVWKFDNGVAKEATTYLRPQTLFNPSKFETYLNEIPVANMQMAFEQKEYTDADIYKAFWRYGVLEDGAFGAGIEIHEEKLNLCKIPDVSMARAKELLEKEKKN